MRVAIQAWNAGVAEVPAGASWALYRDDGGVLAPLATGTLPAIPAGRSLAAFEVEIALADVGTDGVLARIDDDGTGTGAIVECDETDNTAPFTELGCD